MASKMSKQEKDWQAESDARTLADAAAIKVDEKRTFAAKAAAKRLTADEQRNAKEAAARARQMKSLAANKKNGVTKKATGKAKRTRSPRKKR